MLPVAASASSRPRVGTWRRHPVRRGVRNLDCVSSKVRLRLLGYHRTYSLTRQAVAHENDTPVIGSRDATAAGRDRASFEFHDRDAGHSSPPSPQCCARNPVLMVPPVDCGYRPGSSPRAVAPCYREPAMGECRATADPFHQVGARTPRPCPRHRRTPFSPEMRMHGRADKKRAAPSCLGRSASRPPPKQRHARQNAGRIRVRLPTRSPARLATP